MKDLSKRVTPNNIRAALYRKSFYEFVKAAWGIIEPGVSYSDNWHIRLICKTLELAYQGKIRNLAINIPPRFMKSTLVSVCFPAWVLANDSSKKFLCMSYAESLAVRDAVKTRNLITSSWYQKYFPYVQLKSDQNQKAYYETTNHGYRISIGVAGGATGEGGDYIIIDDPLKADEALSDAKREAVNFWYDNTVKSRLNDPNTGVKILIGQRLHEDDLFGHIYESQEEFEKIILPLLYEGERYHSKFDELNDIRTELDEPLWKSRISDNEIKILKVNKITFANQYQQRGSPREGNIYKKEWCANRFLNTNVVARYISWDTASSLAESAAYTTGIVGELTSDYRLYIREVVRGKYEFPQLKEAIEKLANKYKSLLNGIIIESKSSGISVIQSLSQSTTSEIASLLIPFTPTSDKITRANMASVWFENGSIILPPPDITVPWLHDFEEELFTFPNSKYLDQVDSLNQLIIFLTHFLSAGFHARINK